MKLYTDEEGYFIPPVERHSFYELQEYDFKMPVTIFELDYTTIQNEELVEMPNLVMFGGNG